MVIEKTEGSRTFFVGGAPRSGTGMLYALACSAGEAHDALHDCHYLLAHLELHRKWQKGLFGEGFANDGFIQDYFGSCDTFDSFTAQTIRQLLQTTRETRAIDGNLFLKCPQLTPFFPVLSRLLDDAYFIVIYRHPFDNLASMMEVARRQEEAGKITGLVQTSRNLQDLANFLESFYGVTHKYFRQSSVSDRILYVKYEDAVGNTSEVLNQLSAFTGMNYGGYDPAAPWKSRVDYEARARSPHLFAHSTPLYGSPLSAEKIGNYRQVFSAEEQTKLSALDIPNFDRFGYGR